MKSLLFYCVFLFLLLAYSCGGSNDSPSLASTVTTPQDTCVVSAVTLPGNRYTDFTAEEKVLLRAPAGADWQLEVYDLFTCEAKAIYSLPPNGSPDYPYYLADLNYNNNTRLVGIRGYQEFFIVDLTTQQLSKSVKPVYPSGRLEDAESGTILHLEVWEDYLVGTTQDWGAFVFRMAGATPKAILPVAEMKDASDQYRSLFLIDDGNGKYQGILPSLNLNTGKFQVNPLFGHPIELDPLETVYAKGSPYTRVREPNGTYIGIDLRTGELLPVIEEEDIPN
ncbi:MAG: hypothetical protein AAFQ37_01630 [Bacteroidota bacterium]